MVEGSGMGVEASRTTQFPMNVSRKSTALALLIIVLLNCVPLINPSVAKAEPMKGSEGVNEPNRVLGWSGHLVGCSISRSDSRSR